MVPAPRTCSTLWLSQRTPPQRYYRDVKMCHCGGKTTIWGVVGAMLAYRCIILASHFRLLKGAESITTYMFNMHKAQHTFCKRCGFRITPHCLDEGIVWSVVIEEFSGTSWEKAMKENKTIKNTSKE
ncbi:unnamed protein product [Nyctereutes procyonoides]|uniref:(raccoon dog) hypothetical protein n=1 Tax=Nyctereutes procyonoides TaxID=34880 RepID=A0A811YCE1_NYCPR|nr:unnamed protein product [Nyctereutes procyonoides]